MPLRLMLVDDQELVRRGVAAVLSGEDDMEIVGQFSSADQALAHVGELEPNVVLMELHMPGMNGLEAMARLHDRHPQIAVLILTASEQARDLYETLRMGAQGYVLKGATPEELVQAVRQVARGWAVVSPAMAGKLLGDTPPAPEEWDVRTEIVSYTLSPREWEVLQLLADGMSNREIADRLVVSENTVKTHMRSILTKLQLKNRAQAAAYMRQLERTALR